MRLKEFIEKATVEKCPDACCGKPVTECDCGPDCPHCDCYHKNNMQETKAAPKGYHFTRDGKLKRGDADVDGPGGKKLRADPLDKYRSKVPPVSENFMDGKGPGKPGDVARHGLAGKSKAELKKIRSSDSASPRKKQLAHWMLNMHHKEEVKPATFSNVKKILLQAEESKATLNTIEKAFKEIHPGDIHAGTDKLVKRYKKDTPGQ